MNWLTSDVFPTPSFPMTATVYTDGSSESDDVLAAVPLSLDVELPSRFLSSGTECPVSLVLLLLLLPVDVMLLRLRLNESPRFIMPPFVVVLNDRTRCKGSGSFGLLTSSNDTERSCLEGDGRLLRLGRGISTFRNFGLGRFLNELDRKCGVLFACWS